jgi:hypothetical protein
MDQFSIKDREEGEWYRDGSEKKIFGDYNDSNLNSGHTCHGCTIR